MCAELADKKSLPNKLALGTRQNPEVFVVFLNIGVSAEVASASRVEHILLA